MELYGVQSAGLHLSRRLTALPIDNGQGAQRPRPVATAQVQELPKVTELQEAQKLTEGNTEVTMYMDEFSSLPNKTVYTLNED